MGILEQCFFWHRNFTVYQGNRPAIDANHPLGVYNKTPSRHKQVYAKTFSLRIAVTKNLTETIIQWCMI